MPPSNEQIHRAQMAKELLANDMLAEAMTEVRMAALTELGEVDPTDTDRIRRLQAMANCLVDVKANLEAAIIGTGELDGGITLVR